MTSGDASLAPIHAVGDVDPGDGRSPTETPSPLFQGRGLPSPDNPMEWACSAALRARKGCPRAPRGAGAREEAFRVLMARLVDTRGCAPS
jgi:hypothetical protein